MKVEKNYIISTIKEFLIEEDLELYDINIVSIDNISKIEVYVYSPHGLDYKLIERLNFQIQRLLQVINIEKGTYELTISSPGIERSIKTIRHYKLSINENIKVKLLDPINDEYVIYGKLIKVDDDFIYLEFEEQELKLEINNIKKARVVFDKFKEKVKS